MDELRMILRIITIFICIVLYLGIWVSMVKNWDKCMRTIYGYPCIEKYLGGFYAMWISIHVIAVIFAFVWAWTY